MTNISFSKNNIALVVVSAIALFYFNQHLYIVNDHNDFGEYFIRAEFWSEGILYWGGGSDKLLSVVETIAIKLSTNDFLNIYHNINNIITILMLLAIFLFLINKNNFAIEFNVRVLTVIFAFTLPFFLLKGRTVDQSYLLGITLLLWISVYHIKIISAFVALLVFTARPEGAMIIPLFLLVMLIDKDNRKKIAVNFVIFIILLAGFKLLDSYLTTATHIEYQVAFSNWSFFDVNKLFVVTSNFLLIPLHFFVLALVILKSFLYFVFFVIGVFSSIKDRKYYLYLSIPLLYLLMVFGLGGGEMFVSNYLFNADDYEHLKTYLTQNVGYFMIPMPNHFNNTGIPFINQERYFLFLYPFIAVFVVKGLFYSIKNIYNLLISKFLTYQQLTIVFIILIFSSVNILQFTRFKEYFGLEAFYHQGLPYSLRKVGLFLRKFKENVSDSAVIYDFCDPFVGSHIHYFVVFSGMTNTFTKMCKGSSAFVMKYSNTSSLTFQKLLPQQLSEINKKLNFKFVISTVDYEFSLKNKQEIDSLLKKPSNYLINKFKIKYIVAKRKISLRKVKLISKVDGYNIYRTENTQ